MGRYEKPTMVALAPPELSSTDPRRLRSMMGRINRLINEDQLSCVVVGFAGREGELLIPELIDFIESALRMEDSIFRLTRERAVLFLADIDEAGASAIMQRIIEDFGQRFPAAEPPHIKLGYHELSPAHGETSLKEVLPMVFTRR